MEAEHVASKPPPPSFGMYFAALLEVAMLAVFAWHRSWVGLVVWLLYFRFGALRCLVGTLWRGDD